MQSSALLPFDIRNKAKTDIGCVNIELAENRIDFEPSGCCRLWSVYSCYWPSLLCYVENQLSGKAQPTGDFWDEWGPYSECSRSCGGGVTMRTRRCVTQRTDGGHSCVGPEKSYRSCNIQDCPEGSRDFREEQCSQFDGTDFQGKRYKWLPYYGGENPCELSCIPRGENFYFRHKSAVVDGTPCHPGGKDICVDGHCKRLGCDNMLESLQEEDPCLQCGGNGQSCSMVKNSFSMRNLPKGYNQMFIIPVGATTIRIKETVPTRNYLAIKNLRGEYYLNGHWLITQEDNEGVEYEYYLPNGRSMEGYYWSYGSWSTCSKECGSGYQSRLVFCTFDDEAYSDYLCASFPRPLSNRTCNEQQCPQTRRMAYVYEPRLWRPMEAPRVYVQVYSWVTGEWNPCPVTCGGGLQVRRVECMSHDSAGSRVVADSQCASYAPRPLNQQNCNMQKCAQYRVSSWSQCSVTCGSGKQTRDVVCVGSDGASLEDYACGTHPKPPKTQACEMPVCRSPIGWHIGDWGLCSKSCGSGLRERQVICSDRQRNLYRVEECQSKPKPSTVERCNTQPCYRPQEVPSMQDPTGHDNTIQGFLPYIEDPAIDPRYGCCHDGVTIAQGPNKEGCPDSRPQWSPAHGGRRFPARIHHSSSGATHMHRAHRLDPSAMQQSSPAASWTAVGVSIDKSDPSTVEGLVGQQVVLPCRVSPRPSSTVMVEWRRDGVPVDPTRHQQQSDGSLWVGPITLQDSGWFLCVATRDRDRDHRYIYLSVSETSQKSGGISEPDSSQSYTSHSSSRFNIDYSSLVEARAGQTAKLRCAVLPVSSMHAVTVHWSRAGQPLNSLRHSQHSDGTLEINQLTSDDSGLYTCTVTDAQKSEERQIQLRVLGDLRITKSPTDVHVPQGSTAQLPCVVTGENVNVGWSRSVQRTRFKAYDFSGSPVLSPDCVDQPELANCKLIVYARLCSSQYYSSFCCASCVRYARDKDSPGQTR
ncbi:hypothetical protein cypCar_00014307 [Cyprinus carpio]|nr:hypothetical protein cypCar_00014307 [Cyprinus carpio]